MLFAEIFSILFNASLGHPNMHSSWFQLCLCNCVLYFIINFLSLQLTLNLRLLIMLILFAMLPSISSSFRQQAFLLSISACISSIRGFHSRTRAFINQLDTCSTTHTKHNSSSPNQPCTLDSSSTSTDVIITIAIDSTWLLVNPLFTASKCFSASLGYLRNPSNHITKQKKCIYIYFNALNMHVCTDDL